MRTWTAALVPLALACEGEVTLVPPISASAESALISANTRPVLAEAVSVTSGAPFRRELPAPAESVPLFVSLFDCPLEALELPLGPLPVREGSGRPFPRGDRVLQLEPDSESWREVSAETMTAALANIRLDQPEPRPCNDFRLRAGPAQHEAPPGANPIGLVAFRSEWALMSAGADLYWVRPDLSIERIEDPLLEPGPSVILPNGADEAVIVQSGGAVLLAKPEEALRTLAPMPPNASYPASVAFSPSSAPGPTLYVLSGLGLARFDGTEWSMLDETVVGFDPTARPGALWLGPDDILFLPPDAEAHARLIRWGRGARTEIELPDIPRSILHVPDLGVLVGTEGGQLLRLDFALGQAERLDGWSRPMRPIWVAMRFEDSILLGGWSGLMNELLVHGGFCDPAGFTPSVLGASASAATLVGPSPDVLVAGLAGTSLSGSRLVLFRLGRTPAPPARCPSGG